MNYYEKLGNLIKSPLCSLSHARYIFYISADLTVALIVRFARSRVSLARRRLYNHLRSAKD